MHLCCYYRAIGVFVYWLTKSTDIESDNRHYFCPVPDPFSNPLPPLLPLCPAPAHVTPPTEPTDPPNIAAGRVKRVRERNHHPCVCACVHNRNPSYVSREEERGGAQHRKRAYTAIEFPRGALGAGCCRRFAPVQTVKMPVHTCVYIYVYVCMCGCGCVFDHRGDCPSGRFSKLISATRSDERDKGGVRRDTGEFWFGEGYWMRRN